MNIRYIKIAEKIVLWGENTSFPECHPHNGGMRNDQFRVLSLSNSNNESTSRLESKPEGKNIHEYVGEKVVAYMGEFPRSEGSPTGVSVSGRLEFNSRRQQFRVLVEKGNYAYFDPEDVVRIASGEEHIFKDGSQAMIHIEKSQSPELSR